MIAQLLMVSSVVGRASQDFDKLSEKISLSNEAGEDRPLMSRLTELVGETQQALGGADHIFAGLCKNSPDPRLKAAGMAIGFLEGVANTSGPGISLGRQGPER